MATRSAVGYKDTIVYEEKVTQKGEHYFLPYYVGRLLGRGGFAACHEVRIDKDNTKYAIKIIPKEEDVQKRAESLIKIREEVCILKSLNHPGIVKYYNDFQDARYFYIIMELCSGGSLSDIMKKRKILSEVEVRYFLVQMAEIMRYIKARNIIHRDIKLANYFLDENYKLKLGDFGLATQYNDVFKTRRRFCGTPNYIAPEIVERKLYGFEVDAWSTGVLMFTMLFGGPPFQTKNCKDTYEKIRKCSFQFPAGKECSRAAKDFIHRLLCLSPNDRLKFQQFMDHPFIYNYNIPIELEPSFPAAPPGRAFVKTFGRAVRDKKIEPRPQREVLIVTPPKNVSKASSKELRPATKAEARVTYRNALKGAPPKLKPTAYKAIEEGVPAVKIEENLCKQEEQPVIPAAELDIIKKQEGLYEALPAPIDNCEKPVHKKEEPEDELHQDSSTNIKGRKKFQANDSVALAEMERTQKKTNVKEQKLVLLAPSEQTATDLVRPKMKLRLKQPVPSGEEKEIKIAHWQYCSKQIGIAYVLTNHQIGIYFQDSDCMQISSKDSIIHYIYREKGQFIQREIKLNEVEKLRESNESLFSKVQILLHNHRILRNKFPNAEDKAAHEITTASMGDIAVLANPLLSVKNVSKGEDILAFTLTNSNFQFFFNDNTSMFLSLSSNSLSYRLEGKLIVHIIPLSPKDLESVFNEKVKIVCKHYNRLANVRLGEGSERWLLKQEKRKLTPNDLEA